MKEINDRQQLQQYIESHNIASIFNEQLLPFLSLYHFDQGERVCSQGEESNHLYVLVKGKVKISTTSVEGKTLILSFKKPLEIIGDIEYVRRTEIINTVEAVSAVVMIGIHHQWLNKYAKEDANFLQFLLGIITQKFYIKSNTMSFNLMYSVEVRLASYLLSISFDDNDPLFQQKISTSSLPDAANLIGTSYRHLNRVLQKFCADGLVERSKGSLVIKDRDALYMLGNGNIYE